MSTFNAPVLVIPSPQGTPANGNSMAANITSSPQILYLMSKASFSFSWTGTSPIGTISVNGSNNYVQNGYGTQAAINTPIWDPLTLNYQGSAVTTIPVTGNSGSGIIDITATGIYALQFVYTFTSGTGNMTVYFCSKAG